MANAVEDGRNGDSEYVAVGNSVGRHDLEESHSSIRSNNMPIVTQIHTVTLES